MEFQATHHECVEGFFQVVARGGMFFVGKISNQLEGITLHGPKIVTVNMIEAPKEKRLVPIKNFDIVKTRFIPWSAITVVDEIDTGNMNKNLQDIYAEIKGIHLA